MRYNKITLSMLYDKNKTFANVEMIFFYCNQSIRSQEEEISGLLCVLT